MVLLLIGLDFLGLYLIQQDRIITKKFEGKRWDLPARVYSRPLDLYQGANVSDKALENWLKLLEYRQANNYSSVGTYQKQGNTYYIHARPFQFSSVDIEPKQIIKIALTDNKIQQIQTTERNDNGKIRLEPVWIGSIYPDNNEDRIILKLEDIPKPLIDALIATEDRGFYEHHGISVRGTSRAILSNLTGGARQGGSTITQQLIKNFYLNSDRTIKEKPMKQ